jgi:hypothetical protein
MSDTSVVDPDGTGSPTVVVAPQQSIQDPAAAAGYLARHAALGAEAKGNYEDIMKRRQEAIDAVRGKLDDTIAQMRDIHNGGKNGVNLPMLAFAAGLGQGKDNSFSSSLGGGFAGATRAIQGQRMQDEEFLKGISDLQQKQGALGDIVPKEQAALAKEQQIREEQNATAIERATLTSRNLQPHSLGKDALGNVLIFDPKANNGQGAIINASTGKPVDPNAAGASMVGADGKPLIGSPLHGPDFLSAVPKDAMFSPQTIKAIGDYDEAGPTVGGRGVAVSSYNQKLLDAVKQYNPDWNANGFKQQQDIWKEFDNNGKASTNIRSLDTAYGHLGVLSDLTKGVLGNNPQIIQSIIAKANDAAGYAKYTEADAVAGAVAHEMAKVFRDTGMSNEDADEWRKKFDVKKLSADQMQSAVAAALDLMEKRKDALVNSYQRAGGKKDTSKWFQQANTAKADQIKQEYENKSDPTAQKPGTPVQKTKDGREVYIGNDGNQYVR